MQDPEGNCKCRGRGPDGKAVSPCWACGAQLPNSRARLGNKADMRCHRVQTMHVSRALPRRGHSALGAPTKQALRRGMKGAGVVAVRSVNEPAGPAVPDSGVKAATPAGDAIQEKKCAVEVGASA